MSSHRSGLLARNPGRVCELRSRPRSLLTFDPHHIQHSTKQRPFQPHLRRGTAPAALHIISSSHPNLLYTAHTFHALISQPIIVANGMCQRDLHYFNEKFRQPVMRGGAVVFYETCFVVVELMESFGGVGGYGANEENVGFDAELPNGISECESQGFEIGYPRILKLILTFEIGERNLLICCILSI
jgi:hypothetical protein